MDKQIVAVVLSFILYILYVLVPMIPAIVIYRMFPDTKVSARGVLANLNFKTTGAFAAYVITVFLGFFLVQQTHHQISQISHPVWTLKTKVNILNPDGSKYQNNKLIETLTVSIDPELQQINGNKVILSLPGSKKNWEKTQLRFDIPHFGYYILDLGEATENADIDNYELLIKLHDPIAITANPRQYKESKTTNSLLSDNSFGPKISN